MWNYRWTDQPPISAGALLPLLFSALPTISASSSSTTGTNPPPPGALPTRRPQRRPPHPPPPLPPRPPRPQRRPRRVGRLHACSRAPKASRSGEPSPPLPSLAATTARAASPFVLSSPSPLPATSVSSRYAHPFSFLLLCETEHPRPLYSDLNPVTMYYLLTSISFA